VAHESQDYVVPVRLEASIRKQIQRICATNGWTVNTVMNAAAILFGSLPDAEQLQAIQSFTRLGERYKRHSQSSPAPGTAAPATGRSGAGSIGSEESGCSSGSDQPSP